jgi:hypothetical protein
MAAKLIQLQGPPGTQRVYDQASINTAFYILSSPYVKPCWCKVDDGDDGSGLRPCMYKTGTRFGWRAYTALLFDDGLERGDLVAVGAGGMIRPPSPSGAQHPSVAWTGQPVHT